MYQKENEMLEAMMRKHDAEGLSPDEVQSLLSSYGKLLKESRRLLKFNDRTQSKLREAMLDADQANRAKSSFLATMSHEIRTPMNGVVGMVDVLDATGLRPEQQDMVRVMRDSALSLLQIINDILDFSKIEAGKLTIERVSLSLQDVMESVAELLLPNSAEKHVKLRCYVDPELPRSLLGDPVRLRQILFNLVGNAIKFSGGNDDTDAVVTMKAEGIETRSDETGSDSILVRISVSDNGIGMRQEVVDSLFQPFTQAESSTTRRFGGTGLGLTICKNLVDLMDGQIEVSSEMGVGSDFVVDLSLPVAETEVAAEPDEQLQGLDVVLAIQDEFTSDLVTRYAASFGVPVRAQIEREQMSDVMGYLKDNPNLAESSTSVLIVEADAVPQLQSQFLSKAREVRLPLVIISSNRKLALEIEGTGVGFAENDPLKRQVLFTAIGTASGRIEAGNPKSVPRSTRTGNIPPPSVEEAQDRGQLILLVEDNLTNQDVISRQLNLLGRQCVIAGDGLEGLQALQEWQIGLILTDVHMPNMDGLAFASEIRNREAKSGQDRMPIVAITANALQGESQNCLDAGMDDYLSKPVDMTRLGDVVDKWLGPVAEPTGPVPDNSPAQEAPPVEISTAVEEALDLTMLREIFGDDTETITTILQQFVEPAQETVDEILAGVAENDAAAVGAAAHKLKSSARAVGANTLSDQAQALETAGKAANWGDISSLAPQMQISLDTVSEAIATL